MFIPDPDFYPSRIPDPTPAQKEDVEFFVVLPLFVAKNIIKLKIIFVLTRYKNFLDRTQRIV
jgi:hypothetical protein